MSTNRPRYGKPGPWDDEPDYARWREPTTGLVCAARRNEEMGNWCGYVRVPRANPLYRVKAANYRKDGDTYERVYSSKARSERRLHYQLDVHGGVTWNGRFKREHRFGNHWWIGFDCAHAWDLSPGLRAIVSTFEIPPFPGLEMDEVYRDLAYVREQAESLARQISRIGR